MGADDIERRRLRGQDPTRFETAEAQRPPPLRITDADEMGVVHED